MDDLDRSPATSTRIDPKDFDTGPAASRTGWREHQLERPEIPLRGEPLVEPDEPNQGG